MQAIGEIPTTDASTFRCNSSAALNKTLIQKDFVSFEGSEGRVFQLAYDRRFCTPDKSPLLDIKFKTVDGGYVSPAGSTGGNEEIAFFKNKLSCKSKDVGCYFVDNPKVLVESDKLGKTKIAPTDFVRLSDGRIGQVEKLYFKSTLKPGDIRVSFIGFTVLITKGSTGAKVEKPYRVNLPPSRVTRIDTPWNHRDGR